MPNDSAKTEIDRGQRAILRHVILLLDYLTVQNDTKLQAQFSKPGPEVSGGHAPSAAPPCASYATFLTRVARLQREETDISAEEQPSIGDPQLDDLSFLRWARDFLAAVAAPATLQSIELTEQYTLSRTERASRFWLHRIIGDFASWAAPPERAAGCECGEHRLSGADPNLPKMARWLGKTVAGLERRMLMVIAVTLVLSTYAMAGRFIMVENDKALTALLETNKTVEAKKLSIVQAANYQVFASLVKDNPDMTDCMHLDAKMPSAEAALQPTKISMETDASAPAVPARSAAELERATTLGLELLDTCRQRVWQQIRLISENVRLKSWDNMFIKTPVINKLIGWSDKTISDVGTAMSNGFCTSAARAYHEHDPIAAGSAPGDTTQAPQPYCQDVMRLLVTDSTSTASAIQGCITLYILPCLYAFLGAGAATMLTLRRKIDAWQLSYTDRSRIIYNQILGIVFGAVIGLFTGYFTENAGGNGLALSALALLAGYNVPGVLTFLDSLSDRLFKPVAAEGHSQH